FSPDANTRLHLSAGRGFETPTFNELGYRADGGAGLAFDLQPARSRNIELGGKWRSVGGIALEAALFRADTDDELAVARNVGGRSSYRNVGSARRQGMELGARVPFNGSWALQLAYTWLDARFLDAFPICSGSGCTDPATLVDAGSAIPGVAKQQLFTRLQWQQGAWTAALDMQALSRVSVNDPGSARAPGHALAHAELARTWWSRNGSLRGFVRLENL